jgi:SagB-type dehydrogenase family enzyme
MTAGRILPKPTYDEFVSELFHENTKQHRSDARFVERILAATLDPGVQAVMKPTHKLYPGKQIITLPRRFPPSKRSFDEALLMRRSRREFAKTPLPFSVAAKLLHHAYGVTGTLDAGPAHRQSLRAAPSGGALYPIEVYLLARNVEALPSGIYHFNPAANHLEQLCAKDPFADLIRITYAEELRDAAFVLALTGVSIKNRVKYGERGYRFMLMEAGHISQNFLLSATAMNLNAFTLGGFVDDELDRLLQVDGFEETALYLMAAGKPAKSSGR